MKRKQTPGPWGRLAAFSIAIIATLIGVCCRLDPIDVLQRAFWSAVVAGITVALAARSVRAINQITSK